MVNQLVAENLKHRPVRTLLSIVAIGIEVVLILTLVGLSRGMIDEAQRRARGVGADIWVRPPGTSVLSLSGASMPEKMIAYFASQPHVVVATGSIVQSAGTGLDNVQGIQIEHFEKMSGGFRYLEGGPFAGPEDLIVDERYASQNKLKVGSRWKVINREWRVGGIVEPGKLTRLFLPMNLVQDLTGNTGKISQIFIKLDDSKNTAEVVAAFKANPQLAGYGIFSIDEYTSLWSIDNLPAIKPFIFIVIFIAVTVGFIVVFLSMYTAVLERTREIGVLKSLGAQPGYILGILLREAGVLGLLGAVLGVIFSFGTRMLVARFAGAMLVQHIVPDWWPYTTALAVGGAMLGTLYPAWKAVRQDTLEALSYD